MHRASGLGQRRYGSAEKRTALQTDSKMGVTTLDGFGRSFGRAGLNSYPPSDGGGYGSNRPVPSTANSRKHLLQPCHGSRSLVTAELTIRDLENPPLTRMPELVYVFPPVFVKDKNVVRHFWMAIDGRGDSTLAKVTVPALN